MAVTNGTNITAIEKPEVGVDTGPGWATSINNSLDGIDGHDHTTNKGSRITPAAININADVEFNENQATELKGVVLSNTNASTDNSALTQTSGNLFWRNSSGTRVQITDGSGVKSGAGSIDNMGAGAGNQAGASYSDTTKSFSFFTDQGNSDLGKINHSDMNLYKFSDDNTADTDYVTLQADSSISGAGGIITVPGETGTMLTTSTDYSGGDLQVQVTGTGNQIDIATTGTSGTCDINLTVATGQNVKVTIGTATAEFADDGSGNMTLTLS